MVNDKKVNKTGKAKKKAKKKTKESKTSPRRLRAMKKQVAALELRMQGLSFRSIALELKYAGPAGAFAAVEAALKRTLTTHSEEIRQLELERLDRLQILPWKLATIGGDLQAVDRVLAIMKRRASMIGLDAPIMYSFDDIRDIARKLVRVIEAEVKDEDVRERIFSAIELMDEA